VDIINKLNETYLDELVSLLPLHRLLFLALTSPIAAAGASFPAGIVEVYLTTAPLSTLNIPEGTLWQQPWALWGLFIAVLAASLSAAGLVRQAIISILRSAQHKPNYLDRIRHSAAKIKTSVTDWHPLADTILERYKRQRKIMQVKARAAEALLALATVMLCYSFSWKGLDGWLCAVFLVFGLALEFSAHRYYLARVAPSYLLYGFLTERFVELDDGYYP
jgi:hypothetical protein